MKKLFGAWNPEEARRFHAPKHHELQSFGRFWYREIRDFLNSTVPTTKLLQARKREKHVAASASD
jgi:hypothetical protein